MWDEKKFFEDYAKKADTVQPSPEFIEKMASLVKEESDQTFSIKKFSYAKKLIPVAAAACLVLVVGIGGHYLGNSNEKGMEEIQIGELAGEKKQEQEQQQFESFYVMPKEESLQDIVEAIQEKAVLDEQGNEIAEEEKSELLKMLLNAETTEAFEIVEPVKNYTISGTEKFTIKLLEDEQVVVETEAETFYYQINW